jgi:large subunit ribosomal protein L16
LLLQPRKFTFKSKHKQRRASRFALDSLSYGDSGLVTLSPLRLPAKQIFKIKIFLKKAIKRSDYTKRLVWFNAFPHLPLSRKAKGVRMGKGTGKLATWFSQLYGGSVIFEFKNLRPGRATHFFNQVRYKLPTKTTIISPQSKTIKLAGSSVTNTAIEPFYLT